MADNVKIQDINSTDGDKLSRKQQRRVIVNEVIGETEDITISYASFIRKAAKWYKKLKGKDLTFDTLVKTEKFTINENNRKKYDQRVTTSTPEQMCAFLEAVPDHQREKIRKILDLSKRSATNNGKLNGFEKPIYATPEFVKYAKAVLAAHDIKFTDDEQPTIDKGIMSRTIIKAILYKDADAIRGDAMDGKKRAKLTVTKTMKKYLKSALEKFDLDLYTYSDLTRLVSLCITTDVSEKDAKVLMGQDTIDSVVELFASYFKKPKTEEEDEEANGDEE